MKARFPCKWPLGLDVLYAQYNAIADNGLLAFQQPYLDDLGPNLEIRILGSVGYTTLDPQNVEAIMSSRFEGTLYTPIAEDDQVPVLILQTTVSAQDAAQCFPLLAKAFSHKMEDHGSILASSCVDHFSKHIIKISEDSQNLLRSSWPVSSPRVPAP